MKRNLMSELQQRSRSTFLKCRAPCASARSPAANGRSLPHGPPTAASPALSGAASPTSFHPTPPGSSSLLQVSINSEEVQRVLRSRRSVVGSVSLRQSEGLENERSGAHISRDGTRMLYREMHPTL